MEYRMENGSVHRAMESSDSTASSQNPQVTVMQSTCPDLMVRSVSAVKLPLSMPST